MPANYKFSRESFAKKIYSKVMSITLKKSSISWGILLDRADEIDGLA
jgi:hypothetical protein